MTKQRCCKCDRIATWVYGPGATDSSGLFFCDDHVSRGCSCNDIIADMLAPKGHPDADFVVVPVDEQGRYLPCIEYDYEANGFDA